MAAAYLSLSFAIETKSCYFSFIWEISLPESSTEFYPMTKRYLLDFSCDSKGAGVARWWAMKILIY